MNHGWKITLLVVLGAIVFFWLVKAPILSSYLTHKIKVPISISTISVWPHQTIMNGFRVKNPRGFKLPNALTAGKTTVDYKPEQLVSNPCVFDSIYMDKVYLGIEFSNATGTENNWTAIGSNISDDGHGREVIIHKVVITNITVEVRGIQAKILQVPQMQTIERMEFDEIDSKNGFPTKELIRMIFQQAGLEKYIERILSPENIFENVTNPLKIFSNPLKISENE